MVVNATLFLGSGNFPRPKSTKTGSLIICRLKILILSSVTPYAYNFFQNGHYFYTIAWLIKKQ